MEKSQALEKLEQLKPILVNRFGVSRLALFGYTARGEAKPNSDVDMLVKFKNLATSKQFFGVQFLLEDALGQSVDLVTEKAIRPELSAYIIKEAIDV